LLRLIKYKLAKIACKFGRHDYTCAAEQGVEATDEQLEGGFEGFMDYAKMYCKRCGHITKFPFANDD
jgi:hypothetical protein